jgi:hypothetical protein
MQNEANSFPRFVYIQRRGYKINGSSDVTQDRNDWTLLFEWWDSHAESSTGARPRLGMLTSVIHGDVL